MKTLIKGLIILAVLTLFGACGGGSDSKSTMPVTNIPSNETQFFLTRSSNADANSLAYAKQVSKFVDDVALLQSNLVGGDNNLTSLIESYEVAISMLYDPLYVNLNESDKKVVKSYYLSLSSKLEEIQETVILNLNQLMIDEINLNTFASDAPVALNSTRLISRTASSLHKAPSLGFFKLITSIAVAAKNLVTGARAKNDQLIREALKTKESVEGTQNVLKELGISYPNNADGETLYNLYKNLNAGDQRKVDNTLTNMSVEIWEDSSAYGGKFADVDLFEAKRRSNDTIVPLFKKTITEVGTIVIDTVGVQTPNLQVVNDYNDAVSIYKNVKILVAPTKPFKVLAVPKRETTSGSVEIPNSSYEDAKKTINTLNNKDGYNKTKLALLEDSIKANIKEQASKDNDGDNTILSLSSPISTMSIVPIIKATDHNHTQLTLDVKLPSLNDDNISLNIVSVDENDTLDNNTLPEDIVIENFDNVEANQLTTTPLIIMNLVNTGTILSQELISENNDSLKYRVTAVVNDIYKHTNGYLEIFDGSAIMGNTDRELTNINTHTQTVTWDVDVIGTFAMLKFTRSDDNTYSDYIQLDGKANPTIASGSTYIGTSDFTEADGTMWHSLIQMNFLSNSLLSGGMQGTVSDGVNNGTSSGSLSGTWNNNSFNATMNYTICDSQDATRCLPSGTTSYIGIYTVTSDTTISIILKDADGTQYDTFTATKQ